jgi:hypothetical protein
MKALIISADNFEDSEQQPSDLSAFTSESNIFFASSSSMMSLACV